MSSVSTVNLMPSSVHSKKGEGKRIVGGVCLDIAQKISSTYSYLGSILKRPVSAQRNVQNKGDVNPIRHPITYDVYDACRTADIPKLKEVLSKGENPNLSPTNWGSPLSQAVEFGNEEMARVLLEAKADPNLAHVNPQPLYHAAVYDMNEGMCRLLVEHKADPFVYDEEGRSIIGDLSGWKAGLQQRALRIVQICTGTEGMKVFSSCKNIHDFFAVLFPPCKEALPSNSESIIAKIPECKNLRALDAKAEDLKGKWPSIEEASSIVKQIQQWDPRPNPPSLSFSYIRKLVTKIHPLFARAWELSGQPELRELHEPGNRGSYRQSQNKIFISKDESNDDKLDAIVFETLHAVQKDSTLENLHEQSREDFTFAIEYGEWRSVVYRDKIWKVGGLNLPECWLHMNQTGHAEAHRKNWDEKFSTFYWANNRAAMKEKIDALRQLDLSVEVADFKESKQ